MDELGSLPSLDAYRANFSKGGSEGLAGLPQNSGHQVAVGSRVSVGPGGVLLAPDAFCVLLDPLLYLLRHPPLLLTFHIPWRGSS